MSESQQKRNRELCERVASLEAQLAAKDAEIARLKRPEVKNCATCHFGVDGDGDTVYCNWTGAKRMPKDGGCEDYSGEHPDIDYYRREAAAAREAGAREFAEFVEIEWVRVGGAKPTEMVARWLASTAGKKEGK